jgi:aldehyde dehydrogenase (NAD+)
MTAAVLQLGIAKDLPSAHFIDGHWQASDNGAMMETFDPGSAKPHASFAAGSAADVDAAVGAAKRAG